MLGVNVGLALVLVASGCTGESEPTASPAPERGYEELMVSCLDEAGWEVRVAANGALENVVGIPDGQQEHYFEAMEKCDAEHAIPVPALTADDAGAFHDALVEQAECLEALGYTMPQAPSREAAIDSMTGDSIVDPLWDPTGELVAQAEGAGEIAEAQRACPEPVLTEAG